MTDSFDWTILDRYFAGDASPDDHARLQGWLHGDASREALLAQWHDEWRARDVATPRWELDTLRRRIVDRTVPQAEATLHPVTEPLGVRSASRSASHTATSHGPSARGPLTRWTTRGMVLGVAAAVLLVVGLMVGRQSIVRFLGHHGPTITYAVYSTQNAQVAHLTLDDGTRVTLAPNSTVGIARDFAHRRDVTLTGEAYFDVARSHGTPFLVHTGTVTTRVLGTTFDILHTPQDASIRVAVLSGKVAVGGRQGVTLTAGGVAHVTDSTATVTTVDNVNAYAGWTDGQLTFRHVAVPEMLDVVGRWYGVRFHLLDSTLVHEYVALTFATGESRANALALLQSTLGVRMTFNDLHDGTLTVTLHPKAGTGRRGALRTIRQDSLFTTIREVGR